MRWGHGHFVVFASAAATGAGRAVAVAHDPHVTYVGDLVAPLPIHLTALVMAVRTGLLVTARRTAGFASDRARSGHEK